MYVRIIVFIVSLKAVYIIQWASGQCWAKMPTLCNQDGPAIEQYDT